MNVVTEGQEKHGRRGGSFCKKQLAEDSREFFSQFLILRGTRALHGTRSEVKKKKRHNKMDAVKPPGPLKLTVNVDASWRALKQQLLLYIAAVGVDPQADERKKPCCQVFNIFVFAQPEDKDKFDEVLKEFDKHYLLKKNEMYERYVFRSRLQQQGETFDTFLTDLKIEAQSCNFVISETL